jgi:hypothetical protein
MLMQREDWERAGRGRSLQFFATDEEVERLLSDVLPEEYEPFLLVGVDVCRQGDGYVRRPFEFKIRDFRLALESPQGRRWSFFLGSGRLTPQLRADELPADEAVFSLSGLVHLQHGRQHRGLWTESSIGVVDRVRNIDTGEVREHERYLGIYKTLESASRKILKYPAIQKFADGHEEIVKTIGFSSGMAKLHAQGIPMTMRPALDPS